ncbi:hypothetical protein KP509_33G040200 [Ceratopteris richardii]|nr:hypothetical protein KP509_33G040200 [Ceratopteris richardii]
MATLDEKCFPPDFVVCTLLLDMNINLKRLDRAKEMYDRIRSLDYVPDVTGCTNLINFLCESGNPEAGEMILAEMEDEKLHGTIDTYLTVLRGYGKQGKVDEAVRIFRMMKEDTFLNPHMGPDVYSEAMNAYVRGNKLSSAVLTMEDMLHMGMIPDDESISLLIAAYEQKNQFERALDVLLKLESRAVRPGVNTLTTLIVWFGKLGLLEEVETLFKCIEQKVDTPDSKAYASLYSAYARAGLIDKTKAILDRIEASKVILDASAYEQMILALECGKQREAAQNLRDQMIAEGLTPSDEVERALLGVDASSFLSGVTKSVEETQSNGTETESFLAGVHKDLEQPEPS